jgi:HEPN domain-containing protein
VCFHCQQTAEKYLKALLEENGLKIPKIHDLEELCSLLLPTYQSLRSVRRGLAFLTRFAVEIRYPGDNANKREAVSALRWAGKVRTKARSFLGLPRA